jgi:hypothetical protein
LQFVELAIVETRHRVTQRGLRRERCNDPAVRSRALLRGRRGFRGEISNMAIVNGKLRAGKLYLWLK